MKTVVRVAVTSLCILCQPAFSQTQPLKSRGNAFNPDTSINVLGLWSHASRGSVDLTDPDRNGFSLQEAEIQFSADVDPYFRAVALFSISQTDGTTDYGFSPEEVYAETTSIPHFTLKGGKFKAALGKQNQLHTHAFSFIQTNLIDAAIFGDEGLNDPGISASALIPAPWFSEFTLQAMSSSNGTAFNSGNSGQFAGVGQWRNLVDLTDNQTIEVTAMGTHGKNAQDLNSTVWGGEVFLKSKFPEADSPWLRGYSLSARYLDANVRGNSSLEGLSGISNELGIQLTNRYWARTRAEWLGVKLPPGGNAEKRQSVIFEFDPSEFSAIRLQYDRHAVETQETNHRVSLQLNFSIGAHPAHAY